jgi:exopolyphosphatase/guanosine-5'-triphosphate,3'-diphosphate pyrophosphatase
MGGAVASIAAVKHVMSRYDPSVVQGTVLDRAETDRQIEMCRSRDAAERRLIVGLQLREGRPASGVGPSSP